jgi:hypothetical protein
MYKVCGNLAFTKEKIIFDKNNTFEINELVATKLKSNRYIQKIHDDLKLKYIYGTYKGTHNNFHKVCCSTYFMDITYFYNNIEEIGKLTNNPKSLIELCLDNIHNYHNYHNYDNYDKNLIDNIKFKIL